MTSSPFQTPADWNVVWHRSAHDLPAALWERCFPPPLEGLWWYLALEDSGLQHQFDFYYAALEKNGQSVGIAPAFVFNVPIDLVAPPLLAKVLRRVGKWIPSVRYQRTLFVGSPCSDEGTVGLAEPVDFPDAANYLQQAIIDQAGRCGAPMIVWKDFPADVQPALQPQVTAGRLFAAASYPGTRVTLPPTDFDAYLKTLSSSRRNKLKKKLKRSHQSGPLETSVVRELDAATLDEVFGLFWQTYEKGKTKFEVLNRDFFRNIQSYEGTRFVLLRDPANGRVVAFMLCFLIGRRVVNKFIGLDYQNYGGDWFLYFRLWESAVSWAIGEGVADFQSGQTGYSAKFELGHELVPLTNYCRHRNPVLHRIFAKVAAGISWASLDADLKTHLAAHPEAQVSSGGHAH